MRGLTCQGTGVEAEDNLKEPVLSFYCVGPGREYLFPLSDLTGPTKKHNKLTLMTALSYVSVSTF